MRWLLVLVVGCATDPRYEPMTPPGTACSADCTAVMESCETATPASQRTPCYERLDTCFRQCLKRHGGDYVPRGFAPFQMPSPEHQDPPPAGQPGKTGARI
jgi:hypothetical protein